MGALPCQADWTHQNIYIFFFATPGFNYPASTEWQDKTFLQKTQLKVQRAVNLPNIKQ
jgi:hypothetical protein